MNEMFAIFKIPRGQRVSYFPVNSLGNFELAPRSKKNKTQVIGLLGLAAGCLPPAGDPRIRRYCYFLVCVRTARARRPRAGKCGRLPACLPASPARPACPALPRPALPCPARRPACLPACLSSIVQQGRACRRGPQLAGQAFSRAGQGWADRAGQGRAGRGRAG